MTTNSLPPGQRVLPFFPRFGLPWYAHKTPGSVPEARIELVGPDGQRAVVDRTDLDGLPDREQRSDFHCVTTWSRRDVRWSGVPFRDLHEQLLRPRVDPSGAARFIRFRGVDGYADTLPLDDLLADNVLLALGLDGAPLPLEHGAPVRLVTPDHYGYKNVKHLARIELRRRPGFPWPLSLHHPRARVAHQERFRGLPGTFIARIYRAMIKPNLWWFGRYENRADEPG
jgi:DMSO/TMAO reductase YedYZ molybdopterin-dependent catalytic subunit